MYAMARTIVPLMMARNSKSHRKYARVWLYLHEEQETLLDRAAALQGDTLSDWGRETLLRIAEDELRHMPARQSEVLSRRPNENYERRRIVLMSEDQHAKLGQAARRSGYTIGKWASRHLMNAAMGVNHQYDKILSEATDQAREDLVKQVRDGNPPKWLVALMKKPKKH